MPGPREKEQTQRKGGGGKRGCTLKEGLYWAIWEVCTAQVPKTMWKERRNGAEKLG